MDKLFVYVEGMARGEPGEAGIGIAVTDKDGNVIEEVSRLIGRSTSEVAEYRALLEGCRTALSYSPKSVILFTADQRLANHINGIFETRKPHLKHLADTIKGLLDAFPQWRVNLIDRDANRLAHRLVKQAFHNQVQARMTRERLELRLLARTATLSDAAMEKLIEYADRLQGE
ncbi:hypothetical protein DRJ12_00995 [Candidatus Acetothermia bacterium]|jgi:ribonuclease HI|nr:ribonuclease HI family protein [Candidatus Bipolaricaulota bacterium]RLE38917.1 MAG: hypothetical protein DRJ12_00995 [Candidatus Acetothermia bacterium]RLE39261.1 MAG: hypothetical protein DRJ23_03920 [Candidatus Acetothermia bacterium]